VEILKRLREAVRKKRPELWSNDWILHHNNAPAHKALSRGHAVSKGKVVPMLFLTEHYAMKAHWGMEV